MTAYYCFKDEKTKARDKKPGLKTNVFKKRCH